MSTPTYPESPPRWPFVAVGAAAIGALAALGIALTTPDLPGSEPMTLEDVVDVAAILVFGVLGAVLVHRRRAEGLGRALVLLGVLESLNYLLGGVADAIAQGQSDPPAIARLCMVASEAAFIAMFFVFILAPLLLFPTGRLPSPRWRWVAWAAVIGAVTSMFSVLLAPGPVDEDNPAWGDNPLGLDALAGVTDMLELVGVVLLLIGVLSGLAGYVTRWVRYRGPRRRQMAWFTVGVVTMVGGLIIDTNGKSVVLEVLLAAAIFGTMLFALGWPLLGPLGRAAEEADADRAATADELLAAEAVHPATG
jgi:hypothetical protein